MSTNSETEPLEVLPPSAIMAMERAQIDTQVATAHQYPRKMVDFKRRALEMATLDEDTAESCVYCRPVGKEKDEKTGEWVPKFAEGASIRMAEIVAASYGNIRVASRVIEQTERFVRCEGVAHDLESNYAGKSECIESTVDRNGKPYSERQRALMAKVCLSKAYRDAVFKVVPRALAKPVLDAAQKVATMADRPIEERRKKARAWVSSLKIDENRVLAVLGVKTWEQTNGDHITRLIGLKTAMGDGDENIDSVFPPLGQSPTSGQPTSKGPEATAHQQATQTQTTKAPEAQKPADKPKETAKPAEPPKQAAKEPTKAPEAPQTSQKAPEAVQTPPAAQTPQQPAAQEAPQGKSEAATSPETTAELSPEQLVAQEEAAEAAAGLAPQAPQGDFADPSLEKQEGDSDYVLSIKTVLKQSNIPFAQFKAFLISKKLLRENQKDLRDLATARADAINRNLPTWLNDGTWSKWVEDSKPKA